MNTSRRSFHRTAKGDAYAFISDQQGLMASLSIEGTRISKIER